MKILLPLFLGIHLFAASINVQILGSGGPEFSERASSSYLIWIDHKARVMVDMGGGSFLRFTQSGAKIEDLKLVALTHLHIDHSADLPQFMKAGYFTDRREPLPVLGSREGGDFPDISTFLRRLFGRNGAFAYMSDILTDHSDSFQIKPATLTEQMATHSFGEIKVTSIGVKHGRVPALAYSFLIEGKKIVFSGDTSAQSDNLIRVAKDADCMIVHHAIPQYAGKYAKLLHMTPERIGMVAQKANVKILVLSHRMKRTEGKEAESEKLIMKNYKGRLIWAEDLMKIDVGGD